MVGAAVDSFKKEDKQDGGQCLGWQRRMNKYGVELREWKTAETGAEEMLADAKGEKDVALGQCELGIVLTQEALDKHKEDLLNRAHEQFTQALAAVANFPDAIFADGIVLAHLKQDDAAKVRFEQFAKMRPAGNPDRQRALRYISQPELARARMAPPFAITTLDGQRLLLDDLQGKVVLLDFWATWCGPWREALPHMLSIATNFQGQPLGELSVSLDTAEQSWRDFIEKNEMTGLHYRDGGFTGPISKMFGVEAIPQPVTFDPD